MITTADRDLANLDLEPDDSGTWIVTALPWPPAPALPALGRGSWLAGHRVGLRRSVSATWATFAGHAADGRRVVLKLHRGAHSGPLEDAARAQARLAHPALPEVLAVVAEAGQLCVVQELVRGATLESLLATPGALPRASRHALAVDLVRTLLELEQRGLPRVALSPRSIVVLPGAPGAATEGPAAAGFRLKLTGDLEVTPREARAGGSGAAAVLTQLVSRGDRTPPSLAAALRALAADEPDALDAVQRALALAAPAPRDLALVAPAVGWPRATGSAGATPAASTAPRHGVAGWLGLATLALAGVAAMLAIGFLAP